MSLERAARIADAILFEAKDVCRWSFGVVAPRSWSEDDGCESWWLEAKLLVGGASPKLRGCVRFLSVVDRRVEELRDGVFHPVGALEIDGNTVVAWEEGAVREIDFDAAGPGETHFTIGAEERIELLRDAAGAVRGRIVRTQAELQGVLHVKIERCNSPLGYEPISRVAVRVENVTQGTPPGASRAWVMRTSLVSTHVLVTALDCSGRFLSVLDPPDYARDAAAEWRSTRSWPVLVCAEDGDDVVLASPVILYDYPRIAQRGSDFLGARELDEVLARLRGARGEAPTVAPGSRVRLRLDGQERLKWIPDAPDVLFTGIEATVRAVKKDVDGRDFLCVTIDGDPAAGMLGARGIFHYYYPDEVEVLEGAAATT